MPTLVEKMIVVDVNSMPVSFETHKATGREIKQTAISQGVAIKIDFILYEVKDHDKTHEIRDDQVVTLHKKQRFLAVSRDDNSGWN